MASDRRWGVLHLGSTVFEADACSIEAQAFGARIVPVAPLPQALARAADAFAFLCVDAAEAAGPRPGSTRADFHDDDQSVEPRDDVQLEPPDAQVQCNDVEATLFEIASHRALGTGAYLPATVHGASVVKRS